MDVYLAVASKRDTRAFADRPVPDDLRERILDAGRLAGSARNGQPWTFVVAQSAPARAALAPSVYRPELVLEAAFAVLIAVVRSGRLYDFDAGRAAQNMMLTAWDAGVASCPNGIAREEALTGPAGLTADLRPVTILSFGFPKAPRDPELGTAQRWSERAPRRPMTEVVRLL
jgi:nitroreductase